MSSTKEIQRLATTAMARLSSSDEVKTKKRHIFKYVMHSLAIVAAMSVYGCSISRGVVTPMIKRRAEQYFGKDAEFWPSTFNAEHATEKIWADDGTMDSEEAAPMYGLMIVLGLVIPPTTLSIAVLATAAKRKGAFLCKFFCVYLVDAVLSELYYSLVRESFFRASSLLSKMFYRSVGHSAFMYIGIELYWQITKIGVRDHGLPAGFGVIFLAGQIGSFNLYGRVMTSSASSIADAILFEACGLFVELNVADTFLMGRTPFLYYRESAISTWRTLCCKKKKADAVAPEDEQEGSSEDVGEDIVNTTRKRFCADSLWLICISEAYSLVVVGLYTFSSRANPAALPGTPAIAGDVIAVNVLIQVLGEIVFSDALVAFVASRFPKRYVVDVVAERATASRYYSTLAIIIVTLIPGGVLSYLSASLCFTSTTERGADDWALTGCPDPDTFTIDDLQVYGSKWGGERPN
ncbi:hypothetical protein TeGR_g15225 [Tetraparma gracilis]|uniref:Uncharacterized protein n=1 Tax=Tetraparma gracilis TaxID=2962635 RepID=A0ABQ6MAU3_9STRA|nr:hypothetical protein TeGR_g15225 [Tetraparma gracilis]